jgi:hypothetical protein
MRKKTAVKETHQTSSTGRAAEQKTAPLYRDSFHIWAEPMKTSALPPCNTGELWLSPLQTLWKLVLCGE